MDVKNNADNDNSTDTDIEELILEEIEPEELDEDELSATSNTDSSDNISKPGLSKQKKKRRFPIWGRILTAIALIIILITAGWNILINVGKANLYAKSRDAVPQLPKELMDSDTDATDVGWEEGWVRYNGKIYRYNQDILTFLVLGIDKDERVSDNTSGLDGGQSDGNFLVVLNPDDESVHVICINRDCMTDIDTYDYFGNYDTTTKAQLELAHAYGTSKEQNMQNSVKAVSNLFYGIPVHGCVAINMAGITSLNDAIGGVKVESLSTFSTDGFDYYEGQEAILQGEAAYHYIHYRDEDEFNSNDDRMSRQRQYLNAFVAQAKTAIKKNPSLIANLYTKLTPYMTTDISIDEASYIGSTALGYNFSDDAISSIEGETVQGTYYEEFYPDEEALYRLIVEVFYEEVK